MKYRDLKKDVIQLGFEEDDAFDANPEMLLSATNRALIQLNQIEPRILFKEIELPESEEYHKEDVSGFENFDRVSEEPPKIKGKSYGDYYYEDKILFIKGNGEKISISYYGCPELVPDNNNDDFDIPLSSQLYPMLQFLVAHYVWLDDDERKADYYYNHYQEEANIYLQRKKESEKNGFSAYVEGGVAI